MNAQRFVVWICSTIAAILWLGAVSAQSYPNKAIRIVTSEAGAGNDRLARIVAMGISGPLGQPVIVENRGATVSGVVGAQALPDGYTLFVGSNGIWLGEFLQDNPPYTIKDFAPVTTISVQPAVLVVSPTLSVTSFKELIALAKSKPGELNYGSSANATLSHLAGELLKAMADVNIVRVPFKGAGPALNALLGNQVQLTFPTASTVAPLAKAGKLRALAVTGLKPSPLLPDVPTISASGLAGYEVVGIVGVFAPAKTPMAILNRLNQEIVRAINSSEVRQRILALGSEPGGNTTQEFRNVIKADMARMGKLIKDAGIREDK